MVLVNIIACLVLLFSFIGGFKEGAVKNSFSLLSLFITIPVVGISYHLIANLLSFLPGENWENFVGFFITMGLIMVILFFAFLIPRKLIQKIWGKGVFYRLIGAVLNTFNAAIGLVVFTLLLAAYPLFDWLEQAVMESGVLTWLVTSLSFVGAMLPFT